MEQQLIIWFMSSKLGSFISEHHNHRTWMYRCVQYKVSYYYQGYNMPYSRKNFWGRKFELLWLFAKTCSTKFGGMVSSWHQRTTRESFLHNFFFFHQFTKVFSMKIFFTNSLKFSPTKVSRYTASWWRQEITGCTQSTHSAHELQFSTVQRTLGLHHNNIGI